MMVDSVCMGLMHAAAASGCTLCTGGGDEYPFMNDAGYKPFVAVLVGWVVTWACKVHGRKYLDSLRAVWMLHVNQDPQ
jgi:hypothetical protein